MIAPQISMADDLLIMPSCVTHEVPPFESDELRVTIVINLSIK